MSEFRLSGSQREIVEAVEAEYAEVRAALARARALVHPSKREIRECEAAALYALARRQPLGDGAGEALEIGTAYGYSCAVLAQGLPYTATITTLNPKESEYPEAVRALSAFGNVRPLCLKSWDYLAGYDGPALDFIFIDGDHGKVARDFAWWAWLKAGGLLLMHDYAPAGSKRPCQPVFEAAEALRDGLGRDFDVLVQADDGVGVCGFYRQGDEPLPALDVDGLLWDFEPDTGWVRR